MTTIGVAVAGLGVVGRQTVRLLRKNRDKFSNRLGADLRLVAVCDRQALREAKSLGLPSSVARLRNPQDLMRRTDVDIVVELLGGLDAPQRLAMEALRRGIHVVTANKLLLSHRWSQLHKAAALGGGRLYFEGSVAGGIPVLQALDTGFAANQIQNVYGILNGTTNYILTRAEAGLEMDAALREAQKLGFAEKNPAMDLSGQDTAQKISVLISLLTGAGVLPKQIACEGITRIDRDDIAFAKENLGRVARLLGVLKLHWKRAQAVAIEAYVYPTLVPLDHALAGVRNEYNGVMIKTSSAGDLMFYGKGAGAAPTASAVVGDVFMLARDIMGQAPIRRQESLCTSVVPIEQVVSSFYLKLFAEDKPGVLAHIAATLGRRGISIASISQSNLPRPQGVPIVLTTHPASFGQFQKALREILALKTVAKRHTVMRLLE